MLQPAPDAGEQSDVDQGRHRLAVLADDDAVVDCTWFSIFQVLPEVHQ